MGPYHFYIFSTPAENQFDGNLFIGLCNCQIKAGIYEQKLLRTHGQKTGSK